MLVFHIFKREMRANAIGMLVWVLVMAAMSFTGFGEYGLVMAGETHMNIEGMVQIMPRVIQVIFGMIIPCDTTEGWAACMQLWCAMIACLHGALLGANILAKEESDRTAEFLYTRPVRRSAVITGKMLAALCSLGLVVLAGWLPAVFVFINPHAPELMGFLTEVMLPCMFITALIFLLAGMLFSAAFTGRGRAVKYVSGLLVITYFLSVALEMFQISILDFLTPFRYFDAPRVLTNGMEPVFLLLSASLAAIMVFATYFLYAKKDILQ